MVQPGAAEGVVIEQAVQIGGPAAAAHIAADTLFRGALAFAHEKGQGRRAVAGMAVMDLVAAGHDRQRRGRPAYADQRLVRRKGGFQIHEPEAGHGRRGGFQPQRIEDGASQHLEPAADAQQPAVPGRMAADEVGQAFGPQGGQVGGHALGAGQDDYVGLPPVFGPAHGPQAYVRFGGQGRHVGKIGHMPGHDHGDVEDAGRGRRGVRRL